MRREGNSIGFLLIILFLSLIGCSLVEKNNNRQQDNGTVISVEEPVEDVDDSIYGGELVISSGTGSPQHLNHALLSGFAIDLVGTQIFASPLRFDENWNPEPYMAKSWEISEDGLSVTLYLEKNAVFHDSHKVTSEDVAFSIEIVKTYHPFKSMFAPVEKVETPDPYTVVIKLSQQHPAILLALSPPFLPILPKHIYGDGQDILSHPANLAPIGSGPYMLKEFVPEEYISLVKNPDYFIENRPYLDNVIIYPDSDPNEQMVKIKRGEAHLIPAFSDPIDTLKMKDFPYLAITDRGYDAIGPINWLAFNLLRKPFDDKRVRQAVAYAIDMDFVIKYLFGSNTQRATGPIAPHSQFFEADVQTYDIDLEKSNALLDEAGYPVTSNKFRFSVTCDYVPIVPSQQKVLALYLKRQLLKVGIDVRVRKSDTAVLWAKRVSNWDFDMTLDSVFNWGDPVIGVHRTYMSTNIRKGVPWSNTQNYRNPDVDEILKKASIELDFNKRKELYSEFQKMVTEEVPVIWINILPFHTIYNKQLQILPTSIWGLFSPFDTIYWKEKPGITRVNSEIKKTDPENSIVKKAGQDTISLIREKGLHFSLKILNDPENGFLKMDRSGLHVIGFTKEGSVFFDNSHQMKSGMDISSILDQAGNKILPQFMDAAVHGNTIRIDSLWPNPFTHEVGTLTAWCGMFGENDVVCSLFWTDKEEKIK